jgi:rRNA-processing protein FCF1
MLRLYLKDGVDPAQAIEALRGCGINGRNLSAATPLTGISPAAFADHMQRLQSRYIEWVEAVQAQLQNLTDDPAVLGMLHTAAYWEIRQLIPTSPRPVPLIQWETERQIRNLDQLRDDLARRRDRAEAAASGHITVVDTNVLLHYQLPDQIDWSAVVAHAEVRLVIPLRVIEELDAIKFSGQRAARDKARSLLPKLRALVGAKGYPKSLREGATIEIFVEPGPRPRVPAADADTEIIETAHDLARLTRRQVTIVTGDTGMSLRAETEGITVIMMPDRYRREDT